MAADEPTARAGQAGIPPRRQPDPGTGWLARDCRGASDRPPLRRERERRGGRDGVLRAVRIHHHHAAPHRTSPPRFGGSASVLPAPFPTTSPGGHRCGRGDSRCRQGAEQATDHTRRRRRVDLLGQLRPIHESLLIWPHGLRTTRAFLVTGDRGAVLHRAAAPVHRVAAARPSRLGHRGHSRHGCIGDVRIRPSEQSAVLLPLVGPSLRIVGRSRTRRGPADDDAVRRGAKGGDCRIPRPGWFDRGVRASRHAAADIDRADDMPRDRRPAAATRGESAGVDRHLQLWPVPVASADGDRVRSARSSDRADVDLHVLVVSPHRVSDPPIAADPDGHLRDGCAQPDGHHRGRVAAGADPDHVRRGCTRHRRCSEQTNDHDHGANDDI